MAALGPSYMSKEQVGQLSACAPLFEVVDRLACCIGDVKAASKLLESELTKFVAEYLAELRSSRVARPRGSRPLPSTGVSTRYSTLKLQQEPVTLERTSAPSAQDTQHTYQSQNSDLSVVPIVEAAAFPAEPRGSTNKVELNKSSKGRPLARGPNIGYARRTLNGPIRQSRATSGTYTENGQRRMERQEAHALRTALEDMDLQDEARLFAAARVEASELVWHHQHPNSPYQPLQPPPEDRDALKRTSYSRSMSAAAEQSLVITQVEPTRKPSNWLSQSRQLQQLPTDRNTRLASAGKIHELWDSPQKKAYMNLGQKIPFFATRKSSWGKARNTSKSGKSGLFKDPDDRIYEEPNTGQEGEESPGRSTTVDPRLLQAKLRNSVHRKRGNPAISILPTDNRFSTPKISELGSQSTGCSAYTTNEPLHTLPMHVKEQGVEDSHATLAKDGKEIRSKEIRDATSMKLKDRSPKLPQPAFVSDRHDRPIVSFDRNWKPAEDGAQNRTGPNVLDARRRSLKEPMHTMSQAVADRTWTENGDSFCVKPGVQDRRRGSVSSGNSGQVSSVPVPVINVVEPPQPPMIIEPSTQTASISPQKASAPTQHRPLPEPGQNRKRPAQQHSRQELPAHHDPTRDAHKGTALCVQCGVAIAGRTVNAGGSRFHPECFTCFHCGDALECVAFYPEPEAKRTERLSRARETVEENSSSCLDDGDWSPRFYCHLDFHELFSPRCRSCKTPIEGEVVLACGGEWHVGHFFCAQCGDVSCPISKLCSAGRLLLTCTSTAFRRFQAVCREGRLRMVHRLPHQSILYEV